MSLGGKFILNRIPLTVAKQDLWVREGQRSGCSRGLQTAQPHDDAVELVYYVSNPYYQVNHPNYSQYQPYVQPAWHFRGRYDDGTVFDVLIQALKQEFLLPELAPHAGMG